MSRAFVREDHDQEPVVVPPRAPLPEGTPNLVTPRGLAALEAERDELRAEKARVQEGGAQDAARRLTALREQLAELEHRIATAEVVHPPAEPDGKVRLGATVTTRAVEGKFAGEESRLTIVGVDEADLLEGRVAFTAPIAQALLGAGIGDRVRVRDQALEVTAVEYDRPD